MARIFVLNNLGLHLGKCEWTKSFNFYGLFAGRYPVLRNITVRCEIIR